MSRTIPLIPPPLGTSTGNPSSPNTNRVDTMPINDTINTTTITNVAQNIGKEIWNDLILAHEGPSDARDTRIAALPLKFNTFKAHEDVSSSGHVPEITSDFESECETHVPLPPLPKLTGAELSVTLNSFISLADLTSNMADLTLNSTIYKKSKQPTNKKADSFIEKLLLTLMEEVKGLKEYIKVPLVISPSDSHASSSKPSKEKTFLVPIYCGLRNHFTDDCYLKLKCSTRRSTEHMTKDHLEQAVVKRTMTKLKA
ncbi:hypothetical protein Tco_0653544 [Tanacetum coccineum]|uniref:Uncharacterized protein n=1 Tax=Tanacetum coccineum TaxID=301880 RepID=A0ABQ4X170_9ASTR